VNCNEEEVKVELGHASAESGKAAFEALEKALVDFGKGGYDVLVTAPIDKHTIQSDSFRFNGHTDYLENRIGGGQKALMVNARTLLPRAVRRNDWS
ncbi:MAG: 4-hydroxythreonine-4-phosphate dehydrogenase PdxA, partial [Prevotella sp.]|nr:4-hydroxythreonine-4-phosphate dehydrogenase PdxA [Prevotella sp.]